MEPGRGVCRRRHPADPEREAWAAGDGGRAHGEAVRCCPGSASRLAWPAERTLPHLRPGPPATHCFPPVSSLLLSPPTPPKAASLSTTSQGRASPGPESPRAPRRGQQAGHRDQRAWPATPLCPGGSCCPEVGGGGPQTAGLFLCEPGNFKGLKARNGDLSFSPIPGAEPLAETPTVSWVPE